MSLWLGAKLETCQKKFSWIGEEWKKGCKKKHSTYLLFPKGV